MEKHFKTTAFLNVLHYLFFCTSSDRVVCIVLFCSYFRNEDVVFPEIDFMASFGGNFQIIKKKNVYFPLFQLI